MSATPQAAPELCDLTLRIAGMSCAACQSHVQRALAAVPGVQQASVDLFANTAHIAAAPSVDAQALRSAVRKAGYDAMPPGAEGAAERAGQTGHETGADVGSDPGQRLLGVRASLSLLAGGIAMVLSMPLMRGESSSADALTRTSMRFLMPLLPARLMAAPAGTLRWTLLFLSIGTMLFAAPEIYRAAWRAARHRATNMNTLVALGTLIAFAASAYATVMLSLGRPSANFTGVYFEAVVLILGFLLAGRWLEARARHRATASLRAFARTEAGNVRWLGEGGPPALDTDPDALLHAPETLLPLDAVAVGDLIRVLPGDRVPLDGIVLAGRSSVDESMLTGEPLPATRGLGDKLFSGTLNLDGPLLLRATALGADSMQAQMGRLLERARASRAPLQRLADQVSAVFVPAVLALAALTFCIWAVVDNTSGRHLGCGQALSLAVAVLVVACPCAMGLAVPAAMAVSLGSAARAGILIKGAEALERLAHVDTVALDKTGTVTEGKPQIVSFVLAPGALYSRENLLRWSDEAEQASTHPLANAVRAFATKSVVSGAAVGRGEATVLPGVGVSMVLNGHKVEIGNATLLGPGDLAETTWPEGLDFATPMYVVVDGRLQATFFATDTLRDTAATALIELRQLGLLTLLLTGDTARAAEVIGAQLGIAEVRSELLPDGKLAAIAGLQNDGRRVAMVGDGLNDAAALARADAGIAMAAGTDLAREAGHVLLLHHDLRLVPESIRVARRTRRLMRQNLGWALLYNVLGIPLAAGVFLPHFGVALSPAFASAAMALSSVSVLLNSLRLARTPRLSAPQARGTG